MKLYYAAASPFVRKVLIALHETNLLDQVEVVPVAVNPFSPGDVVPALNPLGKIPCLELADGTTLYDSRIITRYLSTLAPASEIYPDDDSLWDALTLEATADGIMDAAVTMIYELRIRPEDKVYKEFIDAQWQKIDRALSAIESRWMTQLNEQKNLPVLAVAAALDYVDFRHDDRNWRDTHPTLATWEAEIRERPSLVATIPVG
ncbi:glutathione S-transferase [Rhodobacterales bacterium 52_120_T64]|nr:glutathione S-transferase [Rhodobacterales bacterium 52_120_T64]